MDTLASRLRTSRRAALMTQAELATEASVALITVSRLEKGADSDPRSSTIKKLARALEVDPRWLLLGDEPVGKGMAA